MRVANAFAASKFINGGRKFDTAIQNLIGKSGGDFDSSGAAKGAASSVGNVGPAFEEDTAGAVFLDDIEAAFESDEIAPRLMAFPSDADQRVSALARPAHQLFARRRGVAHAAFDLHADDIELHVGIERRAEDAQALPNGVQFWAPGAADGNVNFLHFWKYPCDADRYSFQSCVCFSGP